jgi:hypothetical protein
MKAFLCFMAKLSKAKGNVHMMGRCSSASGARQGSESPLKFGDAMISHFQAVCWWSTPRTDWIWHFPTVGSQENAQIKRQLPADALIVGFWKSA